MTAINKDIVVALNEAWDRLVSVIGIRQSNDLKLGDTAGPSYVLLNGVSGTGNTVVVEATSGANIYIANNCTVTGTTELSVDGSTFTLAAMRAATPKYCTNATIAITGTKVWGD